MFCGQNKPTFLLLVRSHSSHVIIAGQMEKSDWLVFCNQSQNTTSLGSGKFAALRKKPTVSVPVHDGIVNNTHLSPICQLTSSAFDGNAYIYR